MRIRSVCLAALLSLSAVSLFRPTVARAQDESDQLSFHGYLTNAFAKTDRFPTDGITKEGEWAYRVIALQARYALTPDDHFVVQVRNRHIGSSMLSEEGVRLDWVYYRHNFGPVALKVGKVPVPLGLYNEMRMVGTVLPFFRAPANFYLEGVETIEGASLSHRLPLGDWSLESMVYGGGIEVNLPTQTPSGPILLQYHTNNNFGAQFWLNTPITGLRVGGSALSFEVPLTPMVPDTTRSYLLAGSIDGTFERFYLRGEYETYNIKRLAPNGGPEKHAVYYGQGGVNLLPSLSLNLQAEVADYNSGGLRYRYAYDRAVGVNYKFSPNIVWKMEGHAATGYRLDQYVAPSGPPAKTNYGIASLSVSF